MSRRRGTKFLKRFSIVQTSDFCIVCKLWTFIKNVLKSKLKINVFENLMLPLLALFWHPIWPPWSPLGAILGACWCLLKPSWKLLEPSWGPLGPSWAPFGPSWSLLGASWSLLVATLGPLVAILRPPGPSGGHRGGIRVPFCLILDQIPPRPWASKRVELGVVLKSFQS